MSHDASVAGTSFQTPFEGHRDARALVRLIQCSQCSLPFRNPITLPCGNSLCRSCLPPPHVREDVSYPEISSRRQGITCPFSEACPYKVHSMDDCSINVVLSKVMETIKEEVNKHRAGLRDGNTLLEEVVQWRDSVDESTISGKAEEEKGHSRTLPGGPLVATYLFAEAGELHYTSDVKYETAAGTPVALTEQQIALADNELLATLKDACQKELDCHVCYNLMLDPITTPCGHTFCRKCLARILDHSALCPVCRRNLPLSSSLSNQPSNATLTNLITSLCPDQVAARAEAVDLDERSAPGGLDTPLFVVSVSFPRMPQLLHVFEPRYRLMIRRALHANGQFGMVAYNEHGRPQGTMGRTQFMQYGAMVQIEHYEYLDDGRIVLQCRGASRFRILAHGMLDGYLMARTEKVDDVGLAEEERLEAEEISGPPVGIEDPMHLDRLSTRQLMEIATDFVQRARERSPSWFAPQIVEVYGGPPEDPAIFPYWFASVLPLHESEKYKLLPTATVRERLKITARWVHKIDAQRWFNSSACNVL